MRYDGSLLIMDLWQAIILAVVQGFTEFLPISSSAHLALAPWLLGWKDQGLTFDIALHFGTLLAVLIYFFRDWLEVAARGLRLDWGSDPQLRQRPNLLWLLAAASVPVGVIGLLFKDAVEHSLRNPLIMGGMLVAVGVLMHGADRRATLGNDIAHITFADAMWIGVAQALAIVPGTSRSGITIAAGLWRGLGRAPAARFSFLLSTPAILAAAVHAGYELYKAGGIPDGHKVQFFVGVAVSALTGCVVIAFFLRYLRHHTLRFFVVYRVILGIIVIALVFFRQPAG